MTGVATKNDKHARRASIDADIGRQRFSRSRAPFAVRFRGGKVSSNRALIFKRITDVVGATIGLVVCGPVMIVIATLIKLDSAGPVLFAQRRAGRGGRSFKCLKFRTMRADAEECLKADPALYRAYLASGYKVPLHADPRVTVVGRFLRRTSLDELPQLFNVLVGHMSLVGPRPVTTLEVAYYGSATDHLLSMRPGMTGLWAVNGRSNVRYPKRARLELAYVSRWSLRHDMCILLKTVVVVATGEGVT